VSGTLTVSSPEMTLSVSVAAPALSVTQTAPSLSVTHEGGGFSLEATSGSSIVTLQPVYQTTTVTAGAQASLTIETGAGMALGDHEALDSLCHRIAESSETEYEYSGDDLVRTTVWTSSAHSTKVRETLFTYSGGVLTQTVQRQYDGAGVLLATLTKVFTYSGDVLSSVASTRT